MATYFALASAVRNSGKPEALSHTSLWCGSLSPEAWAGWRLDPDSVEVLTDVTLFGWCLSYRLPLPLSHRRAVTYNSRIYAETGENIHGLAGNGPVLISDSGRIHQAGTGRPTEEYVAEFER